jgi:hypothetical protein
MTSLRSILETLRSSRTRYEDVQRKDLFDVAPARERRKRS